MIRKLAFTALLAAVAVPVLAGGGSGSTIPVRMKNVGTAPVGVNALPGSTATASQLISGARTIAANGISQFTVPAGAFSAIATNPSAPQAVNKVRNDFSTRTFTTIYLYAQQDTKTATLVGAPGGVKF
jgi:hypothetical protein